MIVDAFLKLLTLPVILALDAFNRVQVTIPLGVFNGLSILAKDLGWIFPVAEILPIFALKIGLRIASIFWTVILKVKSFIPTMGD